MLNESPLYSTRSVTDCFSCQFNHEKEIRGEKEEKEIREEKEGRRSGEEKEGRRSGERRKGGRRSGRRRTSVICLECMPKPAVIESPIDINTFSRVRREKKR